MKNIYKYLILVVVFLLGMNANLMADSWVQKASFPAPVRDGGFGFSLVNKIYFGGGVQNVSPFTALYQDLWEYDPFINAWTQKANYPGSGSYPVTFTINGLAYVGMGGYPDFSEYNPNTNTWTVKANYPGFGQFSLFGFSIGNKGYAGTGSDGVYQYNDFWEYNPSTDIWTQKGNYHDSTEEAVAFSIGNKGFVCGFGEWTLFWSYNPTSDIWTQLTNFPGTLRVNGLSFVLNSKVYCGTGGISSANNSDIWEYDTLTNAWTQKTNFPYNIWYATGFTIGNRGYVYSADTITNGFYEYIPDSSTSCNATFTITPDTIAHHYTIVNSSTGTSPIHYYWTWGDGSHDSVPYPSHTYADTGYYTICLTIFDTTSCNSSFCDSNYNVMRTANAMAYVNVVAPSHVGIPINTSKPFAIKVYPNPATNTLTINLSSFIKNETIEITDVLGKQIYKQSLSGINTIIDISKWSEGVYFYHVKGDNGTERGKFLKE